MTVIVVVAAAVDVVVVVGGGGGGGGALFPEPLPRQQLLKQLLQLPLLPPPHPHLTNGLS